MNAPKLFYEGGGNDDGSADMRVVEQLVKAYAVPAERASEQDRVDAQWKVVQETDVSQGTWKDVFYLAPDTSAEFHAGKIAQLLNKLGAGRLEARRIEKPS